MTRGVKIQTSYRGQSKNTALYLHSDPFLFKARPDGLRYITSLVINKPKRLFKVTTINSEYETDTTASGTCSNA